jgi:hypothetical protein
MPPVRRANSMIMNAPALAIPMLLSTTPIERSSSVCSLISMRSCSKTVDCQGVGSMDTKTLETEQDSNNHDQLKRIQPRMIQHPQGRLPPLLTLLQSNLQSNSPSLRLQQHQSTPRQSVRPYHLTKRKPRQPGIYRLTTANAAVEKPEAICANVNITS